MSKLNPNYEERVEALIKGDNAKAIATKNKKQLTIALDTQIAIKAGFKLDKEEAVENARERVRNVMLNGGKAISTKESRDAVLKEYFDAKLDLQKSENALEQHNLEVQWLEEGYELLK